MKMKQILIIAILILGSGVLSAIADRHLWYVGVFFTIGIPVLMSSVVTGFYCRAQMANNKRISYGAMFACPFLVSFLVILCSAVGLEGIGVFTGAYWSGYRLGPKFMYTIYSLVFAMCVMPALCVAGYHMWRTKREEQPNA